MRSIGIALLALVTGVCVMVASVALQRFGPSPWAVWLLLVAVLALLGLVPDLRAERIRLAIGVGFGSAFLLLWIKSGDATLGNFGAAMQRALIPALMAGTVVGFVASVWSLRHRPQVAPWLAATLFCGLAVAYFSSSKGGPDPMHAAFMRWFSLDSAQADFAVLAVRKTIHFCFYGVTGWLAWKTARCGGAEVVPALWVGLGYAASLAVFDEFRQSSSPVRSGSAWDVLLDLAGVAFFLWLARRGARQVLLKPEA